MHEATVRPTETLARPSTHEAVCPWCRHEVPLAEARFLAIYSHERCADRIRQRELEPLDSPWIELTTVGLSLVCCALAILLIVGPFTRWLLGIN